MFGILTDFCLHRPAWLESRLGSQLPAPLNREGNFLRATVAAVVFVFGWQSEAILVNTDPQVINGTIKLKLWRCSRRGFVSGMRNSMFEVNFSLKLL